MCNVPSSIPATTTTTTTPTVCCDASEGTWYHGILEHSVKICVMYMSILPADYVCVLCECPVPTEVRRGHLILWNLGYKWL